MHLRRVLPITFAATVLLLSGCGDDDEATTSTAAASDDAASSATTGAGSASTDVAATVSPGVDETLTEAFAAVLMEQELTTNAEEATCAAQGIISSIGEARLAELGMTADNIGAMSDYEFTEDEQTIVLGQLFDCIDISVALKQEYVDDGLTEEQAACVVDRLDVEALKELASSGPDGGDAATEAQAEAEVAAFAECGVEAPTTVLDGGPATT